MEFTYTPDRFGICLHKRKHSNFSRVRVVRASQRH